MRFLVASPRSVLRIAILSVVALLVAACAEQSPALDETATVNASVTTTAVPTPDSLAQSQIEMCEDLLARVTDPSNNAAGWELREATVSFFEEANKAGLLALPYQGEGWQKAKAESPRDFVFIVTVFARADGHDSAEALRAEWSRNLTSLGIPYDEAFSTVCAALPEETLAAQADPPEATRQALPLGRSGSVSLDSYTFSVEREMASSPDYAIIHDASGAFEAPGKFACTMETREFIDGSEQVLSIVDAVVDFSSDKAWISIGQGWIEVDQGDPMAAAALTFCAQALRPSPVQRYAAFGESTTRNGIAVWHVDLAAEGLYEGDRPGDVALRYEGWFAEDDLWPVAVIFELETDGRAMAEQYGMRLTDAQERGTISIQSEISDINSPDVHVTIPSG